MSNYEIRVDLKNCFSRDGSFHPSNLAEAYERSYNYAKECAERGAYGGGEILIYARGDDGYSSLQATINVTTKFSGKRYENGYAIPTNEIEVKTDFNYCHTYNLKCKIENDWKEVKKYEN